MGMECEICGENMVVQWNDGRYVQYECRNCGHVVKERIRRLEHDNYPDPDALNKAEKEDALTEEEFDYERR